MRKTLNLALIQPRSIPGNINHNLEQAEALCREAAAAGANFLSLPELFNTGYHLEALGQKTLTLGIEFFPRTVETLSALARELDCYLLCPLVEPCPMPGIVHNSALVFDNRGNKVMRYAKAHLWRLEKEYFLEGDGFRVFDSPFGRVGVMICYDLAFPEAARALCLQGAELILVPAAWRIQDQAFWHCNVSMRALENLCFLAGNNAAMEYEGLHLFGNSKLCDPRGEVIMQAGDDPGFKIVSVDLGQVADIRGRMPYLKDRRPHLYKHLLC